MTRALPRLLYTLVGKAIGDFCLLEEGDVVMIGASGGKDSMVMASILAEFRTRSPVKFELVAATVDLGGDSGLTGDEIRTLERYFAGLGIEYSAIPTSISKIVQEHPTEDSPCSLCANLRRGALNKAAEDKGANKVALGHHLDDAIETLFLNMFYQGSLRCFHPKTYLSRRKITSVRPLCYVPEAEIHKASLALDLPVITTRCPHAGHTLRQEMKDRIAALARDIPRFHGQMRGALCDLWLPKEKV